MPRRRGAPPRGGGYILYVTGLLPVRAVAWRLTGRGARAHLSFDYCRNFLSIIRLLVCFPLRWDLASIFYRLRLRSCLHTMVPAKQEWFSFRREHRQAVVGCLLLSLSFTDCVLRRTLSIPSDASALKVISCVRARLALRAIIAALLSW